MIAFIVTVALFVTVCIQVGCDAWLRSQLRVWRKDLNE